MKFEILKAAIYSFQPSHHNVFQQARTLFDICTSDDPSNYDGRSVLAVLYRLGGWPMISRSWDPNQAVTLELSRAMGLFTGTFGIDTFLSTGVTSQWATPVRE